MDLVITQELARAESHQGGRGPGLRDPSGPWGPPFPPQPRERVPGGCDSEPEAPPPRRWGRGRAERILSLQAATQGRGGLPA